MASIDLTVKVWFHGGMRTNPRGGQIGLMLLVVMGIVISLVLSIASRSLFDVTLSRQENENSATFAIAESGVEQALLALSEGSVNGGILADSTNLVTGSYGIQELDSFDMYVKEGETAQIDLTGAPTGVEVAWVKPQEKPGTCAEGSGSAPAAIEVTLIDSLNRATRAYYNANGCDLSVSNGFEMAGPGDEEFESIQAVEVTSQNLMRIKPLYNGTTIRVTGNNLASQLYVITAQASGGDARTDIEAKRTLDTPGSIFDYALFSDTTIIK